MPLIGTFILIIFRNGDLKLKFAIFDVDLTITRKDTFIEFYKFLCTEDKRFYSYFNRVLFSGIMYKLKIYDEKKSKEQYLSIIKNLSVKTVDDISKKFFSEWIMKKLILDDAMLEIKMRKNQGYKIILISASPEFYLNNFHSLDFIDYVLGTKYEVIDGLYTGKMVGFNNKGSEKVSRFYKFLCENKFLNVDLENSCMYSDSLSDLPLFNIVGNRFIINSKKRIDDILNLYWK